MKWLEIIELRTANRITGELKRSLNELISSARQEHDPPIISIFSSYSINGDYSVHLLHRQQEPGAGGSVLGLRIADALRSFGMVNHQVWCGLVNGKTKKERI